MRTNHVQYQALAEPVALFGEVITPSKWWPVFPDFALSFRRAPHLEGGIATSSLEPIVPVVPAPELSWQPVFPDFATAHKRIPFMGDGSPLAILDLSFVKPPELSWAPSFPDFARALFRRAFLDPGFMPSGAVRETFPLTPLVWLPAFPDRIFRPIYHPNLNEAGILSATAFIVPLTEEAQFPALYQRQPDFARAIFRQPQYYPFHSRRETDLFGVWLEPAVNPAGNAWTEPAQSPISSTWSSPSTGTSTWVEPAITPVVPSPDRTT